MAASAHPPACVGTVSPPRVTALALCVWLALVGAAPAATYKWVDEAGRVHYSDRIPPEQSRQKRSLLDSQGRQVEVIEGAKSPAALERERALRHFREETARLIEEQRNLDGALLRTYASEEDMRLVLNDQILQSDASIHILEKYRSRHMDILRTQEKRAADMERQGQAVTPQLLKAIEDERRRIADYEEKIRILEDKKRSIADRFGRDIQRFRSLKAERARTGQGALGEVFAGGDDGVLSAVVCSSAAVCAKTWALARAYAIGRADTPVAIDTDRLVYTSVPLSDQEIALTLARITGPDEETIFLDVRCRRSSLGLELCASSRVRDIRAGFRAHVESGMGAGP
ncbi:DUF4124 domain-containing protein [Methylococcus capsulatus]|jgi:hypothetical protein|uniref:DUF4124 domain-containing protein n=1 Tax=Methylococcus capsulatus TaxID=414 RepID=UPI001C533C89|nr:DUF4124 domain-containing protein [Methylococcus capsulatus]QXP91897.1 DUF4124 domain-containing protein [Methylococcus capsulatus]